MKGDKKRKIWRKVYEKVLSVVEVGRVDVGNEEIECKCSNKFSMHKVKE